MFQLGRKQELTVVKEVNFGVYLSENYKAEKAEERVLLPKKEVPQGLKIGDKLEVFLYKDSQDRLIATTREPYIEVGKVSMLKVTEVTGIGAFLDWGMPKELLLPFKEQTKRVRQGEMHLVAAYIDKSSRLCATMNVYEYLHTDSPYKKDDRVIGTIYEISENFGVFVAVDNRYSALIPKKEAAGRYNIGDSVEARVTAVKEDGKLDLSTREKVEDQMQIDAEAVLEVIEEFDGVLPFGEKASPDVIRREFGLSKAAFKRAIGRLYKEGKIILSENSIRIKEEE